MRSDQHGFILLEMVIVLGVVLILTAFLVPVMGSHLENARIVSVRVSLERIYQAMLEFFNDLGFWPKYVGGTAPGGDTYDILRSQNGEAPASLDAKWLETARADLIEDHVIRNEPGYREKPAAQAQHGWNGPYLSDFLPPDPWGNKWYINVEFLDEKSKPSEKYRVWVLSAGPNEIIETPYEQFQTSGVLGGDDIGLAIIH